MEKPKPCCSNDILVQNTKVRGAMCPQCRAKLYPVKLLKPHLLRHQLKKSWLEKELEKLQLAVGNIP